MNNIVHERIETVDVNDGNAVECRQALRFALELLEGMPDHARAQLSFRCSVDRIVEDESLAEAEMVDDDK